MYNAASELYGNEAGGTADQPPERVVDLADRDSVLDFTNHYLETYSRQKNIDEVQHITAVISRYKGPRIVRWATLESFVTGLEGRFDR